MNRNTQGRDKELDRADLALKLYRQSQLDFPEEIKSQLLYEAQCLREDIEVEEGNWGIVGLVS